MGLTSYRQFRTSWAPYHCQFITASLTGAMVDVSTLTGNCTCGLAIIQIVGEIFVKCQLSVKFAKIIGADMS